MSIQQEHTTDVIAILVENHRQFLSFLTNRVGNVSDAEEILQAAFVKTVEKSDTIRDGESVVPWFYRLLRNAVIDHYRHQGAESRALENYAAMNMDAETPEPDVEQAICKCVNDLIPTLSADYGSLIKRIDLDGKSIAEIASETGMTSNNVRVKLYRARNALRKQLKLSCGSCVKHACLDCDCENSSNKV